MRHLPKLVICQTNNMSMDPSPFFDAIHSSALLYFKLHCSRAAKLILTNQDILMTKFLSCCALCVYLVSAAPRDVAEILALPESRIDLGKACFILSQDAYPELNIAEGLSRLDQIARSTQKIFESFPDSISLAKRRINALSLELFTPGIWNQVDDTAHAIFTYDSLISQSESQNALFLPYALAQQKGTYTLLTTLWYVIADRLKWPVSAIRLPYQQLLIRYADKEHLNIDLSNLGASFADSAYAKFLNITPEALRNGIYMRPLKKKEFLAAMLCSSAFYAAEMLKDADLAIAYFKLAIKCDRRNAEALAGFGIVTKNPSLVKKARDLGLVAGQKKTAP